MVDKITDTNKVIIVGKVVSEKEFSHEMYGEGFYNFELGVPRLSDYIDILPVTISERLLVNIDLVNGKYVLIEGQLRSYNRYVNNSNRLVLTVFARDIYEPKDEEIDELLKKPNEIFIDGYICKPPVYRTTPFGREITDLLIAVNRPYNKSDYIPCISWGRNARFCEKLLVGDHVRLWGRIQSRDYQKRLSNGEIITRTAYEVSISKLEYIENDNNRQKEEEEAVETNI
ncbi:single-stranded DNA-binding protein [Anaerosalibacter bizertensis]|uniref:Single-stranded DNA-binding protein n=1 Tax=Anaerosalibacter bizertensis TaxID=932217 RepID=A0A9Q4FMI3_9FIRM|nr:single-stranded DNA-binding protein [Anaerosalibacter bizertensis]MBV1819033.1 single-stranded DNA-binding protein [Bacteroidales bacterium MSK.15.36]MCB5560007.1 single-stranded DNA-binding protein [Anaerosalibacter bizertensis]MCG4565750.1 single-stranded DNA-binding protein [Anaerosalibacter bizertensis]MCG4586375.1 single-stranded DNA-binding protein [Anaerosalibacter bizertensis]